MSTTGDLSPKQARAIAALMTCRTIGEAARLARVGESTLQRWLTKDPAFRQAWRAAQAELVDKAVAQAIRSAEAGAMVLHQVMMQSTSDFARIAAARTLIEVSVR